MGLALVLKRFERILDLTKPSTKISTGVAPILLLV
jgi:hypothetical protein